VFYSDSTVDMYILYQMSQMLQIKYGEMLFQLAGTSLSVYGKIFTAFYGSNILTANSTNTVIAKFLR